jgi:hypothetical protein
MRQRQAGARRVVTAPPLPLALLAPVLLVPYVRDARWLAWAAFGVAAGYSLSGSV